jgi:hypothetical protein
MDNTNTNQTNAPAPQPTPAPAPNASYNNQSFSQKTRTENIVREKKDVPLIAKIILVVVFSLIVIGFAFVFYYVTTKTALDAGTNNENQTVDNNVAPENSEKPKGFITEVVNYSFPNVLPEDVRTGYCSTASLAQPFRQDAFKCFVGTSVFDPCFSSIQKDKVVCQMNPLLTNNIFVINLIKPLPQITLPKIIKDNWAWFVELEDGVFCSPYTGAKTLVDKKMAYYGCRSSVKGDMTVLIGDLTKGDAWTAKEVILMKDSAGTGWDTKFSGVVKIKKVWQ